MTANIGVDLKASIEFAEVGGSGCGGFALLEGEFWVRVEVLVELFIGHKINVGDFHDFEEGLLRHCEIGMSLARLEVLFPSSEFAWPMVDVI